MRQGEGKGRNNLGRTKAKKCWKDQVRTTDPRSVAANIDYSLVSERWYFFLQLRIGPTDLFMVVPRNDAIFLKIHTNRY